MKPKSKFVLECEADRKAASERREQKRRLAEKLKARYAAADVYVTDLSASIWFEGKRDGARFFPQRNESLLVLTF